MLLSRPQNSQRQYRRRLLGQATIDLIKSKADSSVLVTFVLQSLEERWHNQSN
jgi:hypothetical protein